MDACILSFRVVLAVVICAARFAEPNAPYPSITLCKNCSERFGMSRDQECSLENTTSYQHCRCDADCITYGDCCSSTHYTCLDSSDEIGEKSVSFHCQEIFLGHRDGDRIPPLGQVPIPKTKHPASVNDYRGISLMSVLSKCFCSIIEARLSNWAEKEKNSMRYNLVLGEVEVPLIVCSC